jgi:hypothetical protein
VFYAAIVSKVRGLSVITVENATNPPLQYRPLCKLRTKQKPIIGMALAYLKRLFDGVWSCTNAAPKIAF